MRAWWLLALLAACGDDDGTADGGADTRSGARLRLQWFSFDGVRHWAGEEGQAWRNGGFENLEVYIDRERDESCAAEPWSDGVIRCTPASEPIAYSEFLDPTCETRVIERPREYRYVAERDDSCFPGRLAKLFPVTRTVSVTTLYYRETDGSCSPSTTDPLDVGVLGAELPGRTFATITTTSSPGTDRIRVRFHESYDGMRLAVGITDELLGPARLEDKRAMPTGTGYSHYFANASCVDRVLRVASGCPVPASTPSPISFAEDFARVRERVAMPTLFTETDSSCVPIPVQPGDYYRIENEAIPLADIVTTADMVPGQRIASTRAMIGTYAIRQGMLIDTALGFPCRPFPFPDGVYRCAPELESPAQVQTFFADAACEQLVELIAVSWVYGAKIVLLDDRYLGGSLELREVGEAYRDPVYERANGVCQQFSGGDFYRMGRVVAWDELARAERIVD